MNWFKINTKKTFLNIQSQKRSFLIFQFSFGNFQTFFVLLNRKQYLFWKKFRQEYYHVKQVLLRVFNNLDIRLIKPRSISNDAGICVWPVIEWLSQWRTYFCNEWKLTWNCEIQILLNANICLNIIWGISGTNPSIMETRRKLNSSLYYFSAKDERCAIVRFYLLQLHIQLWSIVLALFHCMPGSSMLQSRPQPCNNLNIFSVTHRFK